MAELGLRRSRQPWDGVEGLSLDFVYLNVLGFLCYTVYTFSFFISNEAQSQYRNRWHSDNLVQLNDVGFAAHALTISAVTLAQTLVLKRSSGQIVSVFARLFIIVSASIAGVLGIAAVAGLVEFIDFLYFLSLVKMAVSLVKYVPQALLNIEKRSTRGWSIGNILLDFTGGTLSIAQSLLDAGVSGNWSGIAGNPIKLGASH
eukprot:jgi/Hompol1/677/HPOL_002513-RA